MCPLLQVVRCLLIEPFPESALNEQAGKLLLENYDEYARHARLVAQTSTSVLGDNSCLKHVNLHDEGGKLDFNNPN